MTKLTDLQTFDVAASDVSVWVFKTSMSEGRPKFTGRWVGITEDLASELRGAVRTNLDGITETIEYDILAQNNEGSALTIMADETYAHLIAEQVTNETPARKARELKQLRNSKFYVAKLVHGDRTLLAVRKTDATWTTRKVTGRIAMVFRDEELDVDRDPIFTIEPFFDFFMLQDRIFVRSKAHFEAVLAYKAGHQEAFETLKAEAEFTAVFADVGPIAAFVGANKIHLRRALSIQQKGHYKDAKFMQALRAEHKNMNLAISFDDQGRIVPTLESCRHIFQALLDHRLESRTTSRMYDVPSTEPVT
jgi:hypothetical protein